MVRVEDLDESIEGECPVDVNLLIHEGLGLSGVAQLGEAIVPTAIGQPFAIHPPGKPFAAVQADLDGEGEPTLNAGMHEAKQGVNQIMVESEAFSETGDKFQFFDVAVAMDIETHAGFNAGQDSNQSGGDPVALSDPAGDGFFVGVAGRKIFDGAALFLSRAQRCVFQLLGQVLGVGAKILQENLVAPEEPLETFDVRNGTQGSSKDQAVKPAQDPRDSIRMICYKMVHGVLLQSRIVVTNIFYFIGDAVSIFRATIGGPPGAGGENPNGPQAERVARTAPGGSGASRERAISRGVPAGRKSKTEGPRRLPLSRPGKALPPSLAFNFLAEVVGKRAPHIQPREWGGHPTPALFTVFSIPFGCGGAALC